LCPPTMSRPSCGDGCAVGCGAAWLPTRYRGWRAGSRGVGCGEGSGGAVDNINGDGVICG